MVGMAYLLCEHHQFKGCQYGSEPVSKQHSSSEGYRRRAKAGDLEAKGTIGL